MGLHETFEEMRTSVKMFEGLKMSILEVFTQKMCVNAIDSLGRFLSHIV